MCMSGLFHETSFQPRSSARITMRWGGGALTLYRGENITLELVTNIFELKYVSNSYIVNVNRDKINIIEEEDGFYKTKDDYFESNSYNTGV